MIIIGEKLNATISGVKSLIMERDEQRLTELVQRQAAAGADFIDINVGTGEGTAAEEKQAMKWAVKIICQATDKPVSIDSANPEVLAAGIEAVQDRLVILNSTTAEPDALEKVLPLAAQYQTKLIGLAMDESGIPSTAAGRLKACHTIADACARHGVNLDSVLFDPLVMPLSINAAQGMLTLNTLADIKQRLSPAKTVMALSNISYGLPARIHINRSFLSMAIFNGLDAVIMDPLAKPLMRAVKAGEAVMGRDKHFRRYSRMFRR